MCGLFGYCAVKHKPVNLDKFNILGWDNDIRGRDSVGRMVGSTLHKWINPKSTITNYKDYVIKFDNPTPSNLAIGHTRKASSGDKTIDHAQPIVLDIDYEGNQFAMVHNGTLYNHIELANKYNINSTGKTDSMILAEIIMNNGFDVLKEYRGAAALIIKDDRQPNTLYVFKGASKIYNDTVEEERPLYFYQESNTSMYISSREEGLFFIADNGDASNDDANTENEESLYTIQDFDNNILYTITDGQIVNEQAIDRSNVYQSKFNRSTPYYGQGNNYYPSRYNVNNNTEEFDTSRLFDYTKRGNSGNSNSPLNAESQYNKEWSKNRQVLAELTTTDDKVIQFARMRYWINDKLANGQLLLNKDGKILRAKKEPGYNVFYFYAGVMIKDKASYSAINRQLGKHKAFKESRGHTTILSTVALHPICTLVHPMDIKQYSGDMRRSVTIDKESPSALFTGEIHPYFSKYRYGFKNGDCIKIEYIGLHKYDNIIEIEDVDTTEEFILTEQASKVPENQRCNNCKGSGISPNTGKSCLLCDGAGISKTSSFYPVIIPSKNKDCSIESNTDLYTEKCKSCKGEGVIDTGKSIIVCDNCNGTGELAYYRENSKSSGSEDEEADSTIITSRLGNQGYSTRDIIEDAFDEDSFFNDEADNILADLAIFTNSNIDKLRNAGYDTIKAQILVKNLEAFRDAFSAIPDIVEDTVKIKFKNNAF